MSHHDKHDLTHLEAKSSVYLHSRDQFTVIRLSARLPAVPGPSSPPPDNTKASSLHTYPLDGARIEVALNGHSDDGDQSVEHHTSEQHSAAQTWIQSLELYFHQDFLASAVRRQSPFSLHFTSSPGLIHASKPSVLEAPRPPYLIHVCCV